MTKNKRTIRIAIWSVCAALGLIFLTIKIISALKEVQKGLNQDLPSTYTITSEDSNIIAMKYLKDLRANII
jgi:hypothetical protein